MDLRPTLDAPDDDPYLWLEEVEGERALAWVAEQTARTRARFADDRVTADREALKAALDRPGHGDDEFRAQPFGLRQQRLIVARDDLGHAVAVSHIDEDQ